jgi:hypothetical protein
VFSWISLLVEANLFDVVDVYFLIVGHTHASIDQYFSVLSSAIFTCQFIGSPLALENLMANEASSACLSGPSWTAVKRRSKPLGVRKISLVYDLKAVLRPMINMNINYYPIPHHFRFENIYGIAAMQYAIYSTQKELLPRRPANISGKYL